MKGTWGSGKVTEGNINVTWQNGKDTESAMKVTGVME